MSTFDPNSAGILNIDSDPTPGAEKFILVLEKGFFTMDVVGFTETPFEPTLNGGIITKIYKLGLIHGGSKFIGLCQISSTGKFFILDKTQTGAFSIPVGNFWSSSYFGTWGPGFHAVATGGATGLGMFACGEPTGKIILSSDNATDGVKEISVPGITFELKIVAYVEAAEMYVFSTYETGENILILVPRTSIDASSISTKTHPDFGNMTVEVAASAMNKNMGIFIEVGSSDKRLFMRLVDNTPSQTLMNLSPTINPPDYAVQTLNMSPNG